MIVKLHAAGVSPSEVEAGARRLLAEARKHAGLGQKDLAAGMGVRLPGRLR